MTTVHETILRFIHCRFNKTLTFWIYQSVPGPQPNRRVYLLELLHAPWVRVVVTINDMSNWIILPLETDNQSLWYVCYTLHASATAPGVLDPGQTEVCNAFQRPRLLQNGVMFFHRIKLSGLHPLYKQEDMAMVFLVESRSFLHRRKLNEK